MNKCPICNSTRLSQIDGSKNITCQKCGYTHKEVIHGKIIKGEHNWWMNPDFKKKV